MKLYMNKNNSCGPCCIPKSWTQASSLPTLKQLHAIDFKFEHKPSLPPSIHPSELLRDCPISTHPLIFHYFFYLIIAFYFKFKTCIIAAHPPCTLFSLTTVTELQAGKGQEYYLI